MGQEHILSMDSVKVLAISVQALLTAGVHPYTLDKTRKCIKPIAGLILTFFLLSLVLTAPIRVIAVAVHVASLGLLRTETVAQATTRWVREATAFAPMIGMLVARRFIRHPLAKTFIHMLRLRNPALARVVEETPRLTLSGQRKLSKRENLNAKLDKTFERVTRLVLLSLLLYVWRQIPYIGRLAAPVMHFSTMQRNLGHQRALALSAVGLVPWLEPCVVRFVEIWRYSHVLAPEVLDEYIAHTVQPEHRQEWMRDHEITISLFLAPHILLMSIPFIGPLFFVPVQAAAAWLADLLSQIAATNPTANIQMQPPGRPAMADAKLSKSHTEAPTRPAAYLGLDASGHPRPAGMTYADAPP
eukprot:jgi/Astpho2/5857/Aster-x1328